MGGCPISMKKHYIPLEWPRKSATDSCLQSFLCPFIQFIEFTVGGTLLLSRSAIVPLAYAFTANISYQSPPRWGQGWLIMMWVISRLLLVSLLPLSRKPGHSTAPITLWYDGKTILAGVQASYNFAAFGWDASKGLVWQCECQAGLSRPGTNW